MRRTLLAAGVATILLDAMVSTPTFAEPVMGEGHSKMDMYWRSCPVRARADDGDINAMTSCAARASSLADSELNRAYRSKMSRLSPARQKVLRSAERAWVESREHKANKCAAVDREPDGREYPFFVELCRADANLARINFINRWR